MELDTGSAVSVLTYKQYKEHFGHEKLAKSLATLKTCTGEKITPKGEMKCNVRFKGLEKELTLLVGSLTITTASCLMLPQFSTHFASC